MDKSLMLGSGYQSKIPALLAKPRVTKKANGDWWISGLLDNLKVNVSEAGLSIKGSPNKYWHGYNFAHLTRQEFEFSIDKLSDTFSLDIKQAKTTSLDIAYNFTMSHPVTAYYPFLGHCRYYQRQPMHNSLYYQNSLRTLIFYDKILEGKSKSQTIPDAWNNKYVLRIELRYKNRLKKQLNRASLTAQDLYSDEVYMQLIDNWVSEYQNIKKNKVMTPNIEDLTSKKAQDFLLSALVAEIGQNKVQTLVSGWNDKFTTNKEAQRFKTILNNLKGLTKESDLIKELDSKILEVQKHYR